MAEVVLAAAASHVPGLTGWPEAADPQALENVRRGFAELAEMIDRARPDVIVGVANDHMSTFRVNNYPDFTVGLADEHVGPAEWFRPWLHVSEYRIAGASELGGIVANGLTRRGHKLARSFENLNFDDNYSVPVAALGLQDLGIPLLPILQNCTVPPVPDQRASYRFGQALGDILRHDAPEDVRVALLATGGLSHEPGGPRYFEVNEAFDRWFLERLVEDDHETILRDVTYERMEEAGSAGTAEVLSWIVVLGAIGEAPCRVHCYEPVVQWRCGVGVVHWELSA